MSIPATVDAAFDATFVSKNGTQAVDWPLWICEDIGAGSEESLLGLLEDRCEVVLCAVRPVTDFTKDEHRDKPC